MAANPDNSINLDLTTGDTKAVLNALTSIVSGLDILNASVLKLQKSGGVAPVLEDATKAAKTTAKEIANTTAAVGDLNKASISGATSMGTYATETAQTTNELGRLQERSRGVQDSLGQMTTDGLKTAKQFGDYIDDLNTRIADANKTIKTSRTELITTTDLDRQKQLSKLITQTKRSVKSLQDEMDAVRISQSQVLRGITDEFTSPLTPIDKLIKMVDKLNAKQEAGGAKIEKMRSTSAKNLAEFTKQAAAIEDTIKKTSDPALIDVLTKRLTGVNDKITAMKKLMGTEEVLKFWEEQSRSAAELAGNIKEDVAAVLKLKDQYDELVAARLKSADPTVNKVLDDQIENTAEKLQEIVKDQSSEQSAAFFTEMAAQATNAGTSVKLLQEQVAKLTHDKKEQEKVFNSTNDPFIKGLAQAKYKEITEELDKQNKKLKEQQVLKRTKIGRDGETFTNKASKGSNAAKDVSTFISSAKAMGDSIGLTSVFAQKFTSVIDLQGTAFENSTVKIGDLINGLSESFEKASSGLKTSSDIQEQFKGFGDNISNWGAKVTGGNQAILDSGGKLNVFQKGLGSVAEKAGGASKLVGGLGTALGAVGSVITAITTAFDIYDKLMGKSSEDIGKRIDAIQKESDVTRQLNDLIRNGSVETLKRQKDEVKANITALKAQADALRDSVVQNTSTFDQIRTIVGSGIESLFGRSSGTIYGQTGDELKNVNSQIAQLDKQLTRLSDGGLSAATQRVADLNAVADKAKDALSEQARQESDLLDARVEAVKNQDKLAQDLKDVDDQLSQDILDEQTKRDEKQKDDIKTHLEDLGQLETDYNKNVLDERRDHLKELAINEAKYIEESKKANEDLLKNLSDEQKDHDKELAKDETKYQEDKQKDYISYQKRIAKMEEDYNKAKIQRQKDLQQSLFEAELDNDALQYFKLQREGEKADKEAAADFEDSKKEEQKQFAEDQADKEAQRAEEKAQNEADFQERQQKEREQAAEAQAERDVQYQKEMADTKKRFAEQQANEAAQYAESRAKNVEEFEKRQKDQQDQYAQEDQDRQTQAEKKRAELIKGYNQELEYFEAREKLLQTYIDALKSVQGKYSGITNTVANGFQDDKQFNAVIDAIKPEIDRLTNIGDSRSIDESNQLKALNALVDEVGNRYQGEFSDAEKDALTTAINNLSNSALASTQSEYANKLKYQKPEDYQAYKDATGGDPNQSTSSKLVDRYSDKNIDGDLVLTSNGWATKAEIEQSNARDEQLRKKYGGKTLKQLEVLNDEQNQTVTSGYNDIKKTRDQAQNQEISDLDDHFYEQGNVSSMGYDDLKDNAQQYYDASGNLLDTANQSELDKDVAHYDASGMLIDEKNQEDLDKTTAHYDAVGEATDEFGNALETGVGGAYQKTATSVVAASQMGTAKATIAWQALANAVVDQARKALASVQSMGTSFSSMKSSGSFGSSSSGNAIKAKTSSGGIFNGKMKPVFAAKGAFIDKPTAVVAGEGKRPEVIFPFDKSKGIPDDILKKMGKGLDPLHRGNGGIVPPKMGGTGGFMDGAGRGGDTGGVLNKGKNTGVVSPIVKRGERMTDQLPYTPTGGSSSDFFQQLTATLKQLQAGKDLNIGSIQVGSNISRDEVRQQFAAFQTAVLELLAKSING